MFAYWEVAKFYKGLVRALKGQICLCGEYWATLSVVGGDNEWLMDGYQL